MPRCRIVFYQTEAERAPVLDWMRKLEARPLARLRATLELLAEHGSALQRPHAAPLRDGISELRVRVGKSRYRVLYFRHGRALVVLSHGFAKKESRVPGKEIDRALRHKQLFEDSPETHTYGA